MNLFLDDRPVYYRILVAALFVISLIILFWLAMQKLSDPDFLFFDDFVEYWSAGKLNLMGGNPYDPEQLIPVQRQTGRTEGIPIMMWNPPWTLTLVMPLSWLPYSIARVLWLLLHIVILFLCLMWSWSFYGGNPDYKWVSWVVGFSFGPLLHVLKAGQIGPLLLLAVVGFFYFLEQGKDWWAGASLVLLTIKPHLLYLFLLAVFLWSVDRRKWKVILGGVIAFGLLLSIAWGINPNLIRQYYQATTNYPPEQWATPTLGAVLRVLFGVQHFWLQFVPSALGAVWFVIYWWRRRKKWCWMEQLPLITLVSTMTAAYGWTFDHTASVLALIPAAILVLKDDWQKRRWTKAAVILVYLIFDGMAIFSSMEQLWYWWMAPFLLGWYLVAREVFLNSVRSTLCRQT
jgi:hypothetical protein